MPRKNASAYNFIGQIIDAVAEQRAENSRVDEYFDNPIAWAKDYLGVQPWSAQGDVMMSVVRDKNVVVKAGHEVGKSWMAGLLIAWWIDTRWHLPGGAFVVSTAPSTKQINAIVWREVRKFHQLAQQRYNERQRRLQAGLDLGDYRWADHPLPGYITSQAHWRLENGIELGYGSKPPDAKEDTMSGIHARYVLAVGDEAVGLSESLIDDLGNITSNATSRRFLILNPTNPLCYVAKIFKNNITSWSRHTISVFDSPNFHGGEGLPIEVLETLVDKTYVQDKISEWGQEYDVDVDDPLFQYNNGVHSKSPKYVARVLGEFAWDAGPTLITMEDMAHGLDADIKPSTDTVGVLGCDVARFGPDMSVIYHYHEGRLRIVDSWSKSSGTDTARRIHQAALDYGVDEVRIDGSGLGGPIADHVAELALDNYAVIEMIGGAASPDKARWRNARAFWFDDFRERLGSGKIDIDEEDEQLQEELLGIEYKFPISGIQSLQIESKDDMKKRGVSSPDFADAAIYACADISGLFGLQIGDQVAYEPEDFFDETMPFYSQLGQFGI